LLVKVQVDLLRLEVSQEGDQVLQAPTEPIDGLGSNHVELAAGDSVEQCVELWAIPARLGAAGALVDELRGHLPSLSYCTADPVNGRTEIPPRRRFAGQSRGRIRPY
jgi:hypothetical protein